MAALDLNLQFFFNNSRALSRVYVTLPSRPIMTVTGGSVELAGDDWAGYSSVRLFVNTSEPPAGLGYSLVAEEKSHYLDSPTLYCELELPKTGGTFKVEALVGGTRDPITVAFTPSGGGPTNWAIPIIVGPTPKPPTTPPNAKRPADLRGSLPPRAAELLELLRDPDLLADLELRADARPIVEALRTARTHARTFEGRR